MVQQVDVGDLSLPRILCLHGGGSNARIFRAQCRVITSYLRGRFRFCFVDGPLLSKPGPDVLSVYEAWGPFRAWIPAAWSDNIPDGDIEQVGAAMTLVEDVLEAAMATDELTSASGPWSGIMGFSQGAKMAASVLLRQQQQIQAGLAPKFTFSFGVLFAGRGPLLSANLDVVSAITTTIGEKMTDVVVRIRELKENGENDQEDAQNTAVGITEYIPGNDYKIKLDTQLRMPTIHVHGLRDPNLHLHRRLLSEWCAHNSAALLEWHGVHRIPIKTKDVAPVADKIIEFAEATGVQVLPRAL